MDQSDKIVNIIQGKVTEFDMRSGHNKSDSQRTRDSIDVLCNYLYNENAGNIALERFLMGFGWTKDKIEKRTEGFSVFNDVKEENVNCVFYYTN